jgi:hypothetical protein
MFVTLTELCYAAQSIAEFATAAVSPLPLRRDPPNRTVVASAACPRAVYGDGVFAPGFENAENEPNLAENEPILSPIWVRFLMPNPTRDFPNKLIYR